MAVFAVTVSGRTVDILAPDARTICFEDIAEHTSRICRYAGATSGHYSVAQHCCLVADACERIAPGTEAGLYGQLHDAHETYIGDVSWTLEGNLDDAARAQIATIRDRLDVAIHSAAGLPAMPEALRQVVEIAHARVAAAEVYCGIARVAPPVGVLPAVRTITAWPAPKAHEKFVESLNARALRHGLLLRLRG
jgi:hypothetical protein